MKHHTHPETYDELDTLEVRRVQIHTRREDCSLTMCTYAEHYDWAKLEHEARAHALKKELKANTEADRAAEMERWLNGEWSDARKEAFEAYFNCADEIYEGLRAGADQTKPCGGIDEPMTLADLDPAWVAKAEPYRFLAWPPYLPAAEEYALDHRREMGR
jgi:hypothetical protein